MNYYKRHLGDYAKDTNGLTMTEHGAFTLLLDRYYASEQPFDKEDAMRVCRPASPAEAKAVEYVLRKFFTLDDAGMYRNDRADAEIQKAQTKAEVNREVGKKGGRPAKSGNPKETQTVLKQNPDENPEGTQDEPIGNPSHYSITPLLQKEEKIGASPDGEALTLTAERQPAIPYQAIVHTYNATMVNLPKVREISADRKTAMRKAWMTSDQRQSVEFWRAYFEECAAEPFTNGTGPYTGEHANWRPDFDYLMRSKVITRIFERAMDRLERSAA